jgi:Ca2+-transporting ATPase
MTPLQKKLEGVADFIGKIGFYTAVLTVFVLFLRYFISRIAYSGWRSTDVGLCFGFIVLGIIVLIVAIPEGLPLAVTIALAYSVRKMFDEQNFVKTLMV